VRLSLSNLNFLLHINCSFIFSSLDFHFFHFNFLVLNLTLKFLRILTNIIVLQKE